MKIRKEDIQNICRLTPLQEGMLFHTLLDPSSSAYLELTRYHLSGPFDLAAFRATWDVLVQRHEVLRSAFLHKNTPEPVQVILKERAVEFSYEDLSALGGEAQAAELEARCVREQSKRFDLSSEPLIRLVVCKRRRDSHEVIWVYHHIILDGWSLGVLQQEFWEIYRARTSNRPTALAPPVPFSTYVKWLRSRGDRKAEVYWRTRFSDPLPALPFERVRRDNSKAPFLRRSFEQFLTVESSARAQSFAHKQKVSLNAVLHAAWAVALRVVLGQEDIVFGETVSGRPPEIRGVERIVGLLINAIPVRIRVSEKERFDDLVRRVQRDANEAESFHYASLPQIQAAVGASGALFDHILVFENYPEAEPQSDEAQTHRLVIDRFEHEDHTNYSLTIQFMPSERLGIRFIYDGNVFADSLMTRLGTTFERVIDELCVVDPSVQIGEWLPRQLSPGYSSPGEFSLVLSATCTIDPLKPGIDWLSHLFGLSVQTQIAPFNQICQELLNPESQTSMNAGINLLLIRWEDFLLDLGDESNRSGEAAMEKTLADLQHAIVARQGLGQFWCVLLPVTARAPDYVLRIQETWQQFLYEQREIEVLDWTHLGQAYSICQVFDSQAQRVGRVPFSDEWFAAASAALIRQMLSWRRSDFKVIAVDCDNTLWSGVCGELGATGVRVEAAQRALQEELVRRAAEGFLIVLVSKNRESDVWAVFEQNPAMLLQRDQVIASRINWSPKSENLRSLAEELNLGLDSFVFIDDSLMECSEVASHVPDVLVIRAADFKGPAAACYYSHIWAFDRFRVTEEDRQRGVMVRAEQERQRERGQAISNREAGGASASLSEFIRSLEVQVDLRPIAEHQWARAAQLTQRTNQFNLTVERVTEAELRASAAHENSYVYVIRVRDRFGDYGIAGLIAGKAEEDGLRLEQFLLSCRVLGRGVEDAVLAGLREALGNHGDGLIRVLFRPTERNQPAKAFLERAGWSIQSETNGAQLYQILAATIDQLRSQAAVTLHENAEGLEAIESSDESGRHTLLEENPDDRTLFEDWSNTLEFPVNRSGRNRAYSEMLRLAHSSALQGAIARFGEQREQSSERQVGPSVRTTGKVRPPYVAPQSEIEKTLASIWSDLLGCDRIGADDDFFELGGHSLKATRLVSRIHKAFQKEIELGAIFAERTLRQMARQIDSAGSGWEAIPRVAVTTEFELSFAQRRMWTLHHMEADSVAYNSTGFYWIQGRIDLEKLRAAIVSVVRDQAVLRSAFQKTEKGLRMVVRAYDDEQVEVIRGLEEQALESFARKLALKPFRLELDPLFVVKLLVFDADRVLLALHMHHIVSDGGSLDIFQRQVMDRYQQGATEAKTEPRTHRQLRYPDYAAWHNAWVMSDSGLRCRDYWLRQLANPPAPLELPTDRPRPPVQSFLGASRTFRLGADVWERLIDQTLAVGGTRFSALVALIKIFLYRHTDQQDILVGTVVSGRDHPDLEEVVGLIANTIALRDSIDPKSSVESVLRQVAETCRQAYAHQGYPFDMVLEGLSLERDLSRSALFDVMVNYHRDEPDTEEGAMSFVEWDVPSSHSRFDLTINALETAEGLTIDLLYNVDLFDVARIERMGQRLVTLATSAAYEPSVAISALDFLPAEEVAWLEGRFLPARTRYPIDKTLIDLFDEVAAQEAETPAISATDLSINYAELVRATSVVASELARMLGERQQPVIAVSMQSRPLAVVAMLGVMRMGGIYLPVDPSYPVERIDYLLKDSGARALVTDLEPHELTEVAGTLDLLRLDQSAFEELLGRGDSVSPVRFETTATDSAYLIYTSGSTGLPKGVLVAHHAFVNMICQQIQFFGVQPKDRIVFFASLSFDASLSEMFMSLLGGGTLCCPARESILDGQLFLEYLQRENISIATLPPQYLRALDQPELPGLKTLITAGESAVVKDVVHYAQREQLRYINAYGPTECAVCTTMYQVPRGWRGEKVPIGKPLKNLGVSLVDRYGRLAPRGHVGEILVRGDGLAKGYLGQPELTRQRFERGYELPWDDGRLYATGDLGMWTENGELLFVGRADDQVKVRGHRVELAEVEHALAAHRDVSSSCVVCESVGDGSDVLVGYYSGQVAKSSLQSFLRERLPAHMIPSRLVLVAKLPMTSNGKVDKNSLATADTEIAPPTEPVDADHRTWRRVWKELLGDKTIGLDDSFFELGGDSIKAIELANRLLREGHNVQVRDIVLHPTIRELVSLIRSRGERIAQSNQGEARPSGASPLTPIQRWFFEAFGEQEHHFNHSEMIRSKEPLEREAIVKALGQVYEAHDQLRARFRRVEGEVDGAVVWEQVIPRESDEQFLQVYDLRDTPNAMQRLSKLANDLQSSFHLEDGPLMVVGLFRCSDGDRLLFVIHHLVIDGVSWRILLDDFLSAYAAFAAGRTWEPAPKGASYFSWARALGDIARSDRLSEQRSYWATLCGFRGAELPVAALSDGRRRSEQRHRSLSLNLEETRLLIERVGAGSELVDWLLAGLGMVLQRWTGASAHLIAYETHGRHQLEGMPELNVSRTVGWFTNVFPMVLEVEGDDSLERNARGIGAAKASIPDYGMGYGLLRYLSGSFDDKVGTSVPRISFNFLGHYGQREPGNDNKIEVGVGGDGESVSKLARILYDLEWNAIVMNGELRIVVGYAEDALNELDLEVLLGGYRALLIEASDVVGV